jgi:hypothetical protein
MAEDEEFLDPSFEVFGMKLCVAEVPFPPPKPRLRIVELLLLATVDCTSGSMEVDSRVLEFAAAFDDCTGLKESNVVEFEFGDRADSFVFEVDRASLVVLDVLLIAEILDVGFGVKAVGLDPADAVLEDTGIGFGREVLGAADKVFESEELPTRLIDQLPGPLKVSLMVDKI